jgi:hypothetical protein
MSCGEKRFEVFRYLGLRIHKIECGEQILLTAFGHIFSVSSTIKYDTKCAY